MRIRLVVRGQPYMVAIRRNKAAPLPSSWDVAGNLNTEGRIGIEPIKISDLIPGTIDDCASYSDEMVSICTAYIGIDSGYLQ